MDPLESTSAPPSHQKLLVFPKFMVTCHSDRNKNLGSLNDHKEGHLSNHLGGRRYE